MKKIRLPKIRLPKIRVPKRIKWLIISLVILAGLALLLALLWKPLLLWQLFPWLVNKVVSNTGMNIWLVRALTIPIVFLLIYAISLMLSLKKKRRMTGFVLLSILIFVISIAMYLFTKEHHFKLETGESLQWYVKAPQGFRLYSTSGYDVVTGEKLKEVTLKIAKEIETWKGKKQKFIKPVKEKYHFFSAVTGEPIRWYYRNEKGRIEIFDKPGFYPKYGERLLPVDKKIVKKYERQIENERIKKEKKVEKRKKEKIKKIEPKIKPQDKRRKKQKLISSKSSPRYFVLKERSLWDWKKKVDSWIEGRLGEWIISNFGLRMRWISFREKELSTSEGYLDINDYIVAGTSKRHIWVVGDGEKHKGYIFHSPDGGKSWELQWRERKHSIFHHYGSSPFVVHFLNKTEGWVGSANGLLYTQNGGKKWELIITPKNSPEDCILGGGYTCYYCFFSNRRIVIAVSCDMKHKTYESLDGGRSWKKLSNYSRYR